MWSTRGKAAAGAAAAGIILAAALPQVSAAAPRHKLPADSATPTAGFCETERGRVATIDLQADDIPAPRCLHAQHDQRLRVRNDLGRPVVVTWRPYAAVRLRPGAAVTFNRPLGAYLMPGDHHAATSAGVNFEVEIPGHVATPAPAFAG